MEKIRVGNFWFRVNRNINDRIVSYTPLNEKFNIEYKDFTPKMLTTFGMKQYELVEAFTGKHPF